MRRAAVEKPPELDPRRARPVLFLLRNFLYLRNFEAPIRELVRRGHRVVVLADSAKSDGGDVDRQKAELCREFGEAIEFGVAGGRSDFRRYWIEELQSSRDVLRYRQPRYTGARLARARVTRKAKALAGFVFDRPSFGNPGTNARALSRLARWTDDIPADAGMVARLHSIDPSVVIVSPMIDLHTTQAEWVRAARHLGMPSVLAVASWDNLTNKSTLHVMPDRILVWNEIQKGEAVELHGVDPATVRVIGAQLYDHWFNRQPTKAYDRFCSELGLDPSQPTILYVGSSISISANENRFVRQWLTNLRASDWPSLRHANVLIRPHPLNQIIYADEDFSELGPVSVYPKVGGFPVTRSTRDDYFNALYHSTLIAGLNTSAIVEAAILGKKCFTVTTAETAEGQDGTFHFHYLLDHGVLHRSDDFEQHLDAMAREFDTPSKPTGNFVEAFLRPRGADTAATPVFVDSVEELVGTQPQPLPARSGLRARLLDMVAATFFVAERLARGAARAYGRLRRV